MSILKSTLPAIVAAVLAAGCSTVKTACDGRVVLVDVAAHSIDVTDLRVTGEDSQFLTMQAMLSNRSGRENKIQWKAVWYNEAGIEIDSAAQTWRTQTLMPYETRPIKSTATSPEAEDAQIYIRRLR